MRVKLCDDELYGPLPWRSWLEPPLAFTLDNASLSLFTAIYPPPPPPPTHPPPVPPYFYFGSVYFAWFLHRLETLVLLSWTRPTPISPSVFSRTTARG